MIFRLRFIQKGGHIHCRLFQATAPDQTWQKNGDLVFDAAGWGAFVTLATGRIELLAEDDPPRYRLVTSTLSGGITYPGIECLRCGRTSWNKNDIEQRYCGHCHIFHEDPL